MKTVICAAFPAFLLTTVIATSAEAAFTVNTTPSTDPLVIGASIQITTDSASNVAIGSYKVKYFFYEPDLPWTPPTATGSPSGTQVNVWRLDRSYTGGSEG